jgi:hypothetical protein
MPMSTSYGTPVSVWRDDLLFQFLLRLLDPGVVPGHIRNDPQTL